jgi:hypothetical protein
MLSIAANTWRRMERVGRDTVGSWKKEKGKWKRGERD